jgi:DeoR/GlpR family transcriptional regulator of sugar metabolism
MTKENRLKFILEKLRQNEQLQYGELSTQLFVSEDTIRRDINELANAGIITKIRGGAQSKSLIPGNFYEKEVLHSDNKRPLAHKAAGIIEENQVVVFDDGKLPFLIAGFLPRDIHLTVVTHSFSIANLTFEFPNIKLIFAGGLAAKNSKTTAGFDVLKKYNSMHADLSILCVHSLHPDYGISHPEVEEAEVKIRIAEMSDQLMVIPKSENLNSVSTVHICKPDVIDYLVTDVELDSPLLVPYMEVGIEVV